MKARVERDLCTSCELCVDICPEVFEMDDEDIAVVKVDSVPADAEDCTRESAESCPGEAIIIEE